MRSMTASAQVQVASAKDGVTKRPERVEATLHTRGPDRRNGPHDTYSEPDRCVRPLSLSLCGSRSVHAAENQAVGAQLSWGATTRSQTDLSSPHATANLWLHLRGVTSFKGAEFD